MVKRRKIKNDKIVEVYNKKGANLSATAIALDVSRRTLQRWKESDEKLAEMMEDVEESLVDFAESKLMSSINDDNITAIIFYLKTKGKKRGYIEQVDSSVTVNPFLALMQSATSEDE